jgi:alkylation response protein AidB-like acyl-CoA dehydrogenase
MSWGLTEEQVASRSRFRTFSTEEISPNVERWEREEALDRSIFQKLGRAGFTGFPFSKGFGGGGGDFVTYGLLNEELARAYASVQIIFLVQGMVAASLARAGSQEQRAKWMPRIFSGETVAAFALTEPGVGSDARGVETTLEQRPNGLVLRGKKRWITGGALADLFLVIAKCGDGVAAALVEKGAPGFSVRQIKGLLGDRACMLAELTFDECVVPLENLVGTIDGGWVYVASTGLDFGRYCTAWASVGISQACLSACRTYANKRTQFGAAIGKYQLVQEMIADMATNTHAARLMCLHAGQLRDEVDQQATNQTMMAKYFSSRIANQAATNAVQIHGANGLGSEYPVQRYMRDAKVREIIEGTTQMYQILIGKSALAGSED